MKQQLTKLKGDILKCTVRLGDLNILITIAIRISDKNLSKNIDCN